MKRVLCVCFVAVAALIVSYVPTVAAAAEPEWVSLFDGKSLDGWEKVGSEQSVWEVKDGAINGSGPASMLVTTRGRQEISAIGPRSRLTTRETPACTSAPSPSPVSPTATRCIFDSTHNDPIRTGSLYGMCHVYKRLVEPDTWFTYEIQVQDGVWRGRKVTKIKITVNGDELYEYFDFTQQFKEGHFAFQQHDPGSKVCIRKVEVAELPESSK